MKKMIIGFLCVILTFVFCACNHNESFNDSDTITDNNTEFVEENDEEAFSSSDSNYNDDDEEYNSDDYVLKTYTDERDMGKGYSCNITLKIGPWVKSADTETINKIWESIGGTGSIPDINSFTRNNWSSSVHFDEGTSIMTFGTINIEDTTPGGFSLAEVYGVDVFSHELKNLTLVDSYIQYGNVGSYLHETNVTGDITLRVNAKMETRNWGPVPFVICANAAMSPEYPDGDPEMIEATWNFGNNEFHISPMWIKE